MTRPLSCSACGGQSLPLSRPRSPRLPCEAGRPRSFSTALGRPHRRSCGREVPPAAAHGAASPRTGESPPSQAERPMHAAAALGGQRSGPQPSAGSLRGIRSSGNGPAQGENVRGPEGGGLWAPRPPQPCAALSHPLPELPRLPRQVPVCPESIRCCLKVVTASPCHQGYSGVQGPTNPLRLCLRPQQGRRGGTHGPLRAPGSSAGASGPSRRHVGTTAAAELPPRPAGPDFSACPQVHPQSPPTALPAHSTLEERLPSVLRHTGCQGEA